ncbi:hypothetical protein ACLKA7_016441 [Drosophila subpalustris]
MAKPKQTQLPLLLLSLLLLLMAVNSAKAVPTLQACGPGLNEALFAFCKGEFAGVIARKRASLDIIDYVEQQNGLDNVVETDVTPWQNELRSILATRRLNRGIVDECCLKPCKYEEINAYCLN